MPTIDYRSCSLMVGTLRFGHPTISGRHCERSEAIHVSASRAMDCFASLAMTRRERLEAGYRRMGRAKRNPSLTRGLDGYRFAPPILRTSRHCERSEAIHSAACGGVDCFALLAMTRIGRGVPDTPACVGYHAPFGPPKILQPAARSRFRSRPCERPFFRSKLTMTDQSVIL